MSPDDSRHGSYAGEQVHHDDGEKPCAPCERAAYRYHKQKRMRLDAGIRNRITLGEKAWGIINDNPRRAVHLSTGISVARLCTYLKTGPNAPVLRSTRERIEAFDGTTVITPVGVTRRIRALNRLGHSAVVIAKDAGCHPDSVKNARRQVPKFVTTEFGKRVAATYERLSMRVPEPSRSVSKVRAAAERAGWPPPLMWDDIDNDPEPARAPWSPLGVDEAVVLRVMAGEHLRTSRAEKDEIARRWRAAGRSGADLERLFGWKPERYGRSA